MLSSLSQKFSDLCYSNRLFFESILRSVPFLSSPTFYFHPAMRLFLQEKKFKNFVQMAANIPFDLLFDLLQNTAHRSNPNKMNVSIESLIQRNNH